ncbi:MAG: hypothetical protein JWP61_835 [Friedmanniella sp.]|nr:hypothetical protein [Friedmanniella sp.]
MAPVPVGEDALTYTELAEVRRAVDNAESVSGLTFSVFVGAAEQDPRAYALRLHGELPRRERAVLVLCDPAQGALEIVTGVQAHRVLPDLECRLAAASMRTSFVGGDIVGGLVNGIQQLGESARQPRMLHSSRR